MALADAAIRRMREYAERGRIGAARPARPVARLEALPRIVRGEAAVVAWETARASEVALYISVPGLPLLQDRVPARGQRTLLDLPVGRTSVVLRATPARRGGDAVERRIVIEVVHPAPAIELTTAHRVVLGEPVRLSWRVRDAERVVLLSPNGDERVELEGAAEFTAYACGYVSYLLRAFGPGGAAERRASVRVVAPELHFEVPQRISARFGTATSVPYSVSGAARLELHAPDRAEPDRLIPAQGTVFLDCVMASENLIFVATGFDGDVRKHCVTVQVALAPDLHDLLSGRH